MLTRIALGLALLLAATTAALATDPDNAVRMELLPGWRTEDGRHITGLRIDLAPGWKTYWRAPGEAGIPPRLSFAGSGNVVAARTHWPVPDVFEAYGLQTIGYEQTVVLPLELTPAGAGPIELRAVVEIGICERVCLPVRRVLRATLPARGRPDPALAAALRDRPRDARAAGVRKVTCRVDPAERGLRVTTEIRMPPVGDSETVVIEPPRPDVWTSAAKASRNGDTLTATVEMVPPRGSALVLDRTALRITVLGDGRAVEIQGCRAR